MSVASRLELKVEKGDSPAFVQCVENIIIDGASSWRRLYVVRIDRHFDPKWCGFSGKVLGALGQWNVPLSLPPFHPSRVISERCFAENPVSKRLESWASKSPIHRKQHSSDNLNRFVVRFDNGASFLWFSGATSDTGRGSIMVYEPWGEGGPRRKPWEGRKRVEPDAVYRAWYASWTVDPERVALRLARGISTEELQSRAGSPESADR